jgi:hypothetical protein
LTDAQWELIAPFVLPETGGGPGPARTVGSPGNL